MIARCSVAPQSSLEPYPWTVVRRQISRGGAKIKVGSRDLGLYGQLMCCL